MPSQQQIVCLKLDFFFLFFCRYESAQQLKGLDEEPGGGEEHFVVLSRADEARCRSLWGGQRTTPCRALMHQHAAPAHGGYISPERDAAAAVQVMLLL